MNEPNNYRFAVKSTENTIKLIEMICTATEPLSFTDIKESLEIPKSSLSYLLEDMEGCGYLTRNPLTLRYSKGIRLIEKSLVCVKNADILSDISLGWILPATSARRLSMPVFWMEGMLYISGRAAMKQHST